MVVKRRTFQKFFPEDKQQLILQLEELIDRNLQLGRKRFFLDIDYVPDLAVQNEIHNMYVNDGGWNNLVFCINRDRHYIELD